MRAETVHIMQQQKGENPADFMSKHKEIKQKIDRIYRTKDDCGSLDYNTPHLRENKQPALLEGCSALLHYSPESDQVYKRSHSPLT